MRFIRKRLSTPLTLLTVLCVLRHAHAFGYQIDRHASCIREPGSLVDMYGLSCTDCARACSARDACVYVSYERYRKRCKLYRNDVATYARKGTGCVGMYKNNIDFYPVPAECPDCTEDQNCGAISAVCPTVVCPRLENIEHGTVQGNMIKSGSRLHFTCEAGYGNVAGTQSAHTTCSPTGDWDPAPVCTDACGVPQQFPNSHLSDPGTELVYECDVTQGFYEKNGMTSPEMTLICDIATESWIVSDFTCVKNCSYLPEVINTDVTPYTNKAGSIVTYTCLYDVSSKFEATCVGFNGTWSGIRACDTCSNHLVEAIPDSDISASDFDYASHTVYFHASFHARLSSVPSLTSAGAWVAAIYGGDNGQLDIQTPFKPFIQARFGTLKNVVGVITAGRASWDQWVKSYAVSYSRDCSNFYYIHQDDDTVQVFSGNTDRTSLRTNYLPRPISAMCVRIHPIRFNKYVSMRFDVIGCAGRCSTYLVSGPYGVYDVSITASNYQDSADRSAPPSQARLDTTSTTGLYGGWVIDSHDVGSNEYIQVQFTADRALSSIVTQGVHGFDVWVTSYRVAYSTDCVGFANILDSDNKKIVFPANTDSNTQVENVLPRVIKARCVRLIPVDYNQHIGLRFDIKGCLPDHVCPESTERFITPNIGSSMALRIMPGNFTKTEATELCQRHGHLVQLDTAEKEAEVNATIWNCPQTANQRFWIDGVASSDRVTFSDGNQRQYKFLMNDAGDDTCVNFVSYKERALRARPCTRRYGYICEFNSGA